MAQELLQFVQRMDVKCGVARSWHAGSKRLNGLDAAPIPSLDFRISVVSDDEHFCRRESVMLKDSLKQVLLADPVRLVNRIHMNRGKERCKIQRVDLAFLKPMKVGITRKRCTGKSARVLRSP
jgi:hypothetical protein